MIPRSFVLVTIIAFASVVALTQTTAPDATVRAFYAYSNSRSSTFNRRHIELRKKWYTQALYREFLQELQDEKAQLKDNPTDKPFFGDGLHFSPLREACEANGRHYQRFHTIGRASVKNNRAGVAVRFRYPKACTSDTETITYQVRLERVGGKWLIADWIYPDGSTLLHAMRQHKYK